LAVHENGKVGVLRSRNLGMGWAEAGEKNPDRWLAGPGLAHIAQHKREIRSLRRLRGKPVMGESSHVTLQEHIDHMGEDRCKRAARAIINFARNADGACDKSNRPYPPADVLLLENLAGLIPDAEREHGINRALVAWNRGHLVKRIEEMAKDVGLKVWPLSPVGTSQVCSRCGCLGRRYSIARDAKTGEPQIRFGFVEKLFACPNDRCNYRANADHNASVNLHRRLAQGDAAVKAWYEWKALPDADRAGAIRSIEAALGPRLRETHGLEKVPF
jgi:transposase